MWSTNNWQAWFCILLFTNILNRHHPSRKRPETHHHLPHHHQHQKQHSHYDPQNIPRKRPQPGWVGAENNLEKLLVFWSAQEHIGAGGHTIDMRTLVSLTLLNPGQFRVIFLSAPPLVQHQNEKLSMSQPELLRKPLVGSLAIFSGSEKGGPVKNITLYQTVLLEKDQPI